MYFVVCIIGYMYDILRTSCTVHPPPYSWLHVGYVMYVMYLFLTHCTLFCVCTVF